MARGNGLTLVMGADLTLNDARRIIAERDAVANAPTPESEPEPEAKVEPVKYNPYRREGDPSADEIRRLSADQLLQLEETEPGMADRLQRATAWDAASSTQHSRDQADRVRTAYDRRLQSDPEFMTAELQRQAREELETRWDHTSDAERQSLASDAGLSADEFSSMEKNHEAALKAAQLKEAGVRDGQAFEDFQSGKGALPSEPHKGPLPPTGTDPYNRGS